MKISLLLGMGWLVASIVPLTAAAFEVEHTAAYRLPDNGAAFVIEYSLHFDDRASRLPVFGTLSALPTGQQPALAYELKQSGAAIEPLRAAAFILSDTPVRDGAFTAPAGEDVHYTLYAIAQFPAGVDPATIGLNITSLRLQTIDQGIAYAHVLDRGSIEQATATLQP